MTREDSDEQVIGERMTDDRTTSERVTDERGAGPSRRWLLASLSALGAIGLAGCPGDGGTETQTDRPPEEPTPTVEPTPTAEPAPTDEPTPTRRPDRTGNPSDDGTQSETPTRERPVSAGPCPLFRLIVVDAESDEPVPDLRLQTTSDLCYETDPAGRVVLDDPGLLGQEVFFEVAHAGYAAPEDQVGIAGYTVSVDPSGTATVEVHPT